MMGGPPAAGGRTAVRTMTAPFSVEVLRQALAALIPSLPDARLCVALSGGADSMVLLHATHDLARREPRLALRAVHVDHGLQPGSGGWAAHCAAACAALRVPFSIIRLQLGIERGASVEAAARAARYAALAEALQEGEWLLTAQHADDQLETVLLQLFRGAGLSGLAAMPAAAPLGRGVHLRPLLGIDRRQLLSYAKARGVTWVEDPMNVELRYDRAYLRHAVLPVLHDRWPALQRTVGRGARHLATAQRLLEGLAAADGGPLVDAAGRIEVAGLRALPRDRQANLLRWWIRECGLGCPATARLDTALDSLLCARPDAEPVVRWAAGELRRYRGRVYAMRPLAEPPTGVTRVDPGASPPLALEPGPGLGRFSLVPGRAGGLPASAAAGMVVRFRAGGETLRPQAARPRKTLRQLFQEAGIVPWMRPRLPLVFMGPRLAAVGDLWLDCELSVPAGVPALMPVWSGRPALY